MLESIAQVLDLLPKGIRRIAGFLGMRRLTALVGGGRFGGIAHGPRLRRGRCAVHAGIELQRVELTRPGRAQEGGLFGSQGGLRGAGGGEGDVATYVRTGRAAACTPKATLASE